MKFVALGKVAKIDRTVASDEECETLPYVGLEHIEKGAGHFAAEFEGKSETLLATKFKFTSKHVLYGKLRPYLNKVALPPFDGVCTTEILPILPAEDKLDRTYLWAFLLTPGFVEWASSNVSGANLPRLSPKLLATYRIPLLPLDEQKRIAAILSKADRLRCLRRYTRELSDGYLGSVFLEMFGDPVANPVGWEIRPLGDSIDGFEGGVNFPPVSEGEDASPWRVLKISAVTWGDFDPSESKPISSDVEFDPSLVVRQGDLIISRANTTALVGAVCLVRHPPPKVLLPDKLWRVRFSEDSKLSPDYTLYALRQSGLRRIIGDLATGTSGSMKNISKQKAATLPIPLAPLPLQQKFAQIVRKFERLRAQQREAERQAEHLLQSLLHQAFRGEL
jgi:type I restriction enzyme S subunit